MAQAKKKGKKSAHVGKPASAMYWDEAKKRYIIAGEEEESDEEPPPPPPGRKAATAGTNDTSDQSAKKTDTTAKKEPEKTNTLTPVFGGALGRGRGRGRGAGRKPTAPRFASSFDPANIKAPENPPVAEESKETPTTPENTKEVNPFESADGSMALRDKNESLY